MKAEEKVEWVYSSKNNKELKERYASWASDYDSDLEKYFNYNAHIHVAEQFAKLFSNKDEKVLDAGAGTGLVGGILKEKGFTQLYAIDMSGDMLNVAEAKGIYTSLTPAVLGEPLDFPTNYFSGVVSAGTFTEGHAPATGLVELIRITKPGGLIVFSLNNILDTPQGSFSILMKKLEDENKWKLISKGELFQPTPIGEPDVLLRIWSFLVI